MTKGAVKVSETDAVISPAKYAEENGKSSSTVKQADNPAVEKKSTTIKITERFARLKKSLRKRSASIL